MDESGSSRASSVPCLFQSFPEAPAEPLHGRVTRLQPVLQLQGASRQIFRYVVICEPVELD